MKRHSVLVVTLEVQPLCLISVSVLLSIAVTIHENAIDLAQVSLSKQGYVWNTNLGPQIIILKSTVVLKE